MNRMFSDLEKKGKGKKGKEDGKQKDSPTGVAEGGQGAGKGDKGKIRKRANKRVKRIKIKTEKVPWHAGYVVETTTKQIVRRKTPKKEKGKVRRAKARKATKVRKMEGIRQRYHSRWTGIQKSSRR